MSGAFYRGESRTKIARGLEKSSFIDKVCSRCKSLGDNKRAFSVYLLDFQHS